MKIVSLNQSELIIYYGGETSFAYDLGTDLRCFKDGLSGRVQSHIHNP